MSINYHNYRKRMMLLLFLSLFYIFFFSFFVKIGISDRDQSDQIYCTSCKVNDCSCTINSAISWSMFGIYSNSGCSGTPLYFGKVENNKFYWKPESSGTYYIRLFSGISNSSCVPTIVGGGGTGKISLELKPNCLDLKTSSCSGGTAVAVFSGVTCTKCRIDLKKDSCENGEVVGYCEIDGSNKACYYKDNNGNMQRITVQGYDLATMFVTPKSKGEHTYTACVDLNGNGIYEPDEKSEAKFYVVEEGNGYKYDFGRSSGSLVSCGEYKYYKVTTPEGKKCKITWTLKSKDINYDLYVNWKEEYPATLNPNADCKSANAIESDDKCYKEDFSGTSVALVKTDSQGCGSFTISVNLDCGESTTTTTTPADTCSQYTSCSSCVPTFGCGWCADDSTCRKGTSSGPSVGSCKNWIWNINDCSATTTTTTTPSCKKELEKCSSDSDCCSGLKCMKDSSGSSYCTDPSKFSCSDKYLYYSGKYFASCDYCCSKKDACGGLSACCKKSETECKGSSTTSTTTTTSSTTTTTTPSCKKDSEGCSSDSDCCSGLKCMSGFCRDPDKFKCVGKDLYYNDTLIANCYYCCSNKESCGGKSACCKVSESECGGSTTTSTTTTTTPSCKKELEKCSSDSDCCSGLKCTYNACRDPSKFICDGPDDKGLYYDDTQIDQCTYCCSKKDACGGLSACCKDSEAECKSGTTSAAQTYAGSIFGQYSETQKPVLSCSLKVGEDGSCSVSYMSYQCTKGLWIILNRVGKPLNTPIIKTDFEVDKNVHTVKISSSYIVSTGKVKAIFICFKPNVKVLSGIFDVR